MMRWESKTMLRARLAAAELEVKREREAMDRLLGYRVRVTNGIFLSGVSTILDVPLGMMLMMTRERYGSETLGDVSEGFNVEVGK